MSNMVDQCRYYSTDNKLSWFDLNYLKKISQITWWSTVGGIRINLVILVPLAASRNA